LQAIGSGKNRLQAGSYLPAG